MKKTISNRLKKFKKELRGYANFLIGYPCNQIQNYKPLLDFFSFSLNNVGDPFAGSNYQVNSHKFEREALQFFARLYKISAKEFWGYVTSGGTEGNMYGLFVGRELHPEGILYFSEDTHYSIPKIARVLKMPHIMVRSLPNGEIDYQELESLLRANRRKPAIFNLNIGTTMKGAIDNLDTVLAILKRNNIKKYYIHCDAALFGMTLPFIKGAPIVNFKKPIGSIAISGHKFIGSPIPCGVVLTRKEFVRKIERQIEYVRILDTTISGSRNGQAPIILWYAIQSKGKNGFKKEAAQSMQNARYLFKKLVQMQIPCMLNSYSNIVVFKKPSERLVKKWQLATYEGFSHIVVMPHVVKEKIDAFLRDLSKDVNYST